MKKYLLLLFVPLAFWACSKSSDPAPAAPELAQKLVGVYNLSYIRYDSATYSSEYTLPQTQSGRTLSGFITVRRDSASVIYTNYTLKITGYADQTNTFFQNGQLKVSGTTPPYDLLYSGTKVGKADGTNFNLDFSYTVGGIKYREVYTARK